MTPYVAIEFFIKHLNVCYPYIDFLYSYEKAATQLKGFYVIFLNLYLSLNDCLQADRKDFSNFI